ncbi:MAG: AraC family transcriptional regulator [Gemmatimonadota bacterium]|nr:AraC family transcriptional regulator [Gemmatimonadota bacterium]
MKPDGQRMEFGQFFGDLVAEERLGDLTVQEIRGRPPGGVPRHTHENAHFCLIVRGDYVTSTRNLEGRCTAGALLFHPAGTTHADQFVPAEGRCVTISLPEAYLEDAGDPRLGSRSVTLDDAEIGFPGARMHRELREPDRFSPLSVEGLALEMIARATEREQGVDGAPAWLERAREFVHHHATDPARVTEVAEAAGVHPVHLARVFRERLGLSPGEYLRRVRVGRALEMMGSTKDGLAAIAHRAGFCDQSELTKAFRREIGTTPARYRRAIRG